MKKIITLALCFVMLFAFVGCSNDTTMIDKLAALENEVNSLKDDIGSLTNEIAELTDEIDTLNDDLQSLTDENALLKDDISDLESQNSSLKNDIDAFKEKAESELPSFEDCEIGYKLQVYPAVAFDYKLPDGTIIHIESITAELTAKNEINEGDLVEGSFYPYEITITIKGSTTPSLLGSTINIFLAWSLMSLSLTTVGDISTDGSFEISKTLGVPSNAIVLFCNAYITP